MIEHTIPNATFNGEGRYTGTQEASLLQNDSTSLDEIVLHAVEMERPRRSIDGERLLAIFSQMIEPLGRALPASSEIVLHDLSLLPNSIVALHGDVTGRRVGDPATNILLKRLVNGTFKGEEAYETVLPDGRRIRSTTVVIHDVSGSPVAALCINTDLSTWVSLQHLTNIMIGGLNTDASAEPVQRELPCVTVQETFATSVEDLSKHIIQEAISAAGIPVELMKKRHKLRVVKDLKTQGMFLLRDGIDIAATTLQVSRFTIYNYLNELDDTDHTEPTADA